MISIATWLVREITQAAKESYPNECCGLLGGTGNLDGAITITQARATSNVAKGLIKNHFEVDPKVHFELIHELRGTNERVIGHYHSHPNHPARPSEEDLKMAFDPNLLWFIISLDQSRINEMKVYKINELTAAFQEIPLTTFVEDDQ
jgi:[CysO sulfur-carrier protein]-S-L-cysteine hydrolase